MTTYAVEARYRGRELDEAYLHEDTTFATLDEAVKAADETYTALKVLKLTTRSYDGRFQSVDDEHLCVLVADINDIRATQPLYVRGSLKGTPTYCNVVELLGVIGSTRGPYGASTILKMLEGLPYDR